mmetsp:Transcript_38699/g.115840  ORF Transcript_38699/g.115840 Transcript_38699/m.115840 type:complete len:184 (-) Transcript_38699:827-1378(-)
MPRCAALLVLASLSPTSSLLLQPSRRSALTLAAAGIAPLAPLLPASARSKEKAAEKALQKATASEARQAMKEYKYAPRPELVGSAETGYAFKAGTVQAGSQGELSSYFKQKGATIQASYAEDKARAAGLSKEEAAKVASSTLQKRKEEIAAKSRRELSDDEKKIAAYAEKNRGMKDEQGRLMF